MEKRIHGKKKNLPLEYWVGKQLFSALLSILFVVLLAYFQTLGMYFWNDDNAIIFKLQHLNEGVGNLGSGIFGFDSPYRMVMIPLIPVYYFFGINAPAFFTYGLFFYFLAAVAVYFFAMSILKEKHQALLVSWVFGSGLVGAESLWRVYNSVHTSITIIFTLLFCTFYFYSSYQKKVKLKLGLYFLALLFYFLAIEWGFVRAHGIILTAVGIELLFNFNWKYSLLRLLPFGALFYKEYVLGSSNTHHFNLLLTKIFEDYNFEILLVPSQTLKNIFIPDLFNVPLIMFIILFTLLLIKFRSRILFFCLIFIIGSFFTYFVIYQEISLNTTHRYLTTALPGFSLLVVFTLSRVFKSTKILYIVSGIYILINLMLINKIHYQILSDRSIPTKNFYTSLQHEIRNLNKNSILYFDTEQSERSQTRFKDFFGVGSMPDTTAIAIYFNKDRYDLYLPQTFEDFIKVIDEEKINSGDIYTFFYSADQGLINTSLNLRNRLFKNNLPKEIQNLESVNLDSSSPFELAMDLGVQIDPEKMDYKPSDTLKDVSYINYLNSKADYYRTAEATASTQWKYQEVNFVTDNDLNSSWMANRVNWHYHSYDWIIVNLKTLKKIGAVKLSFGPTDKAPTKYKYSCSLDGNNWTELNTVYHNPKNHGEEKIDKFNATECLELKLELFDTPKKDAPTITELEVIESDFTNLDLKRAKKIEENPFDYLTKENFQNFYEYFSKNGLPINVCLFTDKNNSKATICKIINIKINSNQRYVIKFDPQGTTLKRIQPEYPGQIKLVINNPTLRYLQIRETGL